MNKKKKIFLILPKKPKNFFVFPELPPLGLLTLATLTDKDRFDITLINENVEKIDFGKKPDIVCVSISTPLAERGYKIADFYQQQNIPVVIGGIHASALPREALNHCTSVVIGECEDIWNEILEDFLASTLRKVYKQKKPTDLSQLPMIDFNYCEKGYVLKNVIQTTRGCPHNCDFCSVTRFYGKQVRHLPVKKAVEEIKLMKDGRKGLLSKWFFITDDNIVADATYARELFEALVPLKVKIIAQSSVSIANDEELLQLAYEAGVRLLFMGFESLDQAFLDELKKPNKASEYKALIQKIKRHRIAIMGSTILDSNHLRSEVWKKTLRFCEGNYELAVFQQLLPFPGTSMYHRNKGLHGNVSWSTLRTKNDATAEASNELECNLWHCYAQFYSLGQIMKRVINAKLNLRASMKSLLILLGFNLYIASQVRRVAESSDKLSYEKALSGNLRT